MLNSRFLTLLLSVIVAASVSGLSAADAKKIVFVAGNPSHGYGSHEHYAGCMLLAKSLQQAYPEFEVVVHKNGWPKNEDAFAGADTVIMYADGGGRHPVNPHLEEFDKVAKRGVGVVCIHYGVEVPKGPSGEKFLDWIGGYFEPHWSVNPHWTAKFDKFPEHPITNGVKPFEINDEWYYHMRFREGMKGVTPILTDLPGPETLSRGDGAHSGNPHVRQAVLERKEPQHVAWACEREDGGRGFGFTGGHFHWNWGDPNFRKLVLNAIVWSAKGEVPKAGVSDKPVTLEALEANQDYNQPGNFNRDEIRDRLKLPAGKTSSEPKTPTAKPIASTKVVTSKTPGHSLEIEADVTGAKQLFLVVTDGGNGYSCDWADWAEPRLIGPAGEEKKLTELKWKSATTDFGQARINQNAGGKPLKIAGKSVEYGIGVHANSVVAYELPKGYVKFKARGGLDNGGTDQGACGDSASVQFHVYTSQPPRFVSAGGGSGGSAASRDPAEAVDQLDVHDGLEATLFASEPMIKSVSNIDIDHLGRVWVCEIVNYRGSQNRRPEGDRIVILEDTDGDGKADKSKVFYQGRDIDSPHGICVLATPDLKGTRVIVSAGDKVQVFTDANGDDKPDKQEVMFSGISGTQHDHGIHAFVFGPDGKLYFNFGNNGNQIKDANGKIIVDMAGNEVKADRKPYQQGMVFRCNLDGSEFETLGWNFRNNWMVTVDSFGTLWQSDNDDDGNRGVRINYVMEFGNYGYRDEFTGAAWNQNRTNWEAEVPLRHWHLNDPGVVPNLLQTGAGSPTGITVYEGDLLPKNLQGQVIHCDAGPNVCRAYPVKNDGAGYSAEIADVLYGARDKWFRPSDVTVALDGSLLVADWYDPGVGGHRAGDLDSGRIFRVAPPGHDYKTPRFDFSTPEGAIEALLNPNYAARYVAWTAIHEMGAKAEPALLKVFDSDNPRHQARSLWLLGKIEGRGAHYVDKAITDKNSDIRILGIRLARQLKLDVIPIVKKLAMDPSPQVRRECLIALRHNESPEMPPLWAELAAAHDGKDRWYLEALGISADKQWNVCLDAWLAKVGDNWNTAGGRDIVWRSRATKTPEYIAQIVAGETTTVADLGRYFRSFDFLSGPQRDAALVEVAFSPSADVAKQTFITTEAFKRLNNFDANDHAAALSKALDGLKGTSQFVSLVDKYNVKERYPEVLAISQGNPDSQVGVEAIRTLLAKGQRDLIASAIADQDVAKAAATARALGNSADGRAVGLLLPIVKEDRWDLELRRQATNAAAKTAAGARAILLLAKGGKLDERLNAAAAIPLRSSPLDDIRNDAAELFPLPPAKGGKLPPLGKLVEMKGDLDRGNTVFVKTGECAKCHVVGQEGKEVGPNLSEIGDKLSRLAMFESIIYPSAGISHNYESYVLATADGNVVTGVLVSQTDQSVTIKSEDAITRTFKKSDIEQMKRSPVSIMPQGLQEKMTTQDLVDVVEYLSNLKKARK